MATNNNLKDFFTDIADAIRSKKPAGTKNAQTYEEYNALLLEKTGYGIDPSSHIKYHTINEDHRVYFVKMKDSDGNPRLLLVYAATTNADRPELSDILVEEVGDDTAKLSDIFTELGISEPHNMNSTNFVSFWNRYKSNNYALGFYVDGGGNIILSIGDNYTKTSTSVTFTGYWNIVLFSSSHNWNQQTYSYQSFTLDITRFPFFETYDDFESSIQKSVKVTNLIPRETASFVWLQWYYLTNNLWGIQKTLDEEATLDPNGSTTIANMSLDGEPFLNTIPVVEKFSPSDFPSLIQNL